jgi:parallel beta-helix repeat protein
MSRLNLPGCPICLTKVTLSRETMERAGQSFTWYECQQCGSVLLRMDEDQWTYQRVGREDKAYLLKKPLTVSNLSELLSSGGEASATRVTTEAEVNREPAQTIEAAVNQQPKQRTPYRLLLVGLAVTALVFIGAVILLLTTLSPGDRPEPEVAFQAGETVVPADTPTPVTLEIGTVEQLQSAVADAPEGVTLVLSPTTFILLQPLEVHNSLSLVGAGMDQTIIVGEAEGYVLLSGSGSFVAEDITFQHQGETEADVVVVEGGEATFRRCRFTGANSVGEDGRSGLVLKGATTALVQDCVADENDTRGIRVAEQAQATLEGNTCSSNERLGLGFFDSSGGVARKNDCSGNGGHGIQAAGQAQPTFEDNISNSNEQIGIAYFDNSGGVARRNTCSGNAYCIGVRNQAQPTLEENSCTDGQGGIFYAEVGGGTARKNLCLRNAIGISVMGQTQPVLEENACHENSLAGITYGDDAGGVARRNDFSRNEGGVMVLGDAQPTLEENTCSDNNVAGIGYEQNGAGKATGNECSRNEVGISVGGQAQPTLAGNTLSMNRSACVTYLVDGGGSARMNQCSGSEFGVVVGGQSLPSLEGNVCKENSLAGIVYKDNSGGLARENDCSNNAVGITVSGQAQPTLEGNACTDNESFGIVYREAGGGAARQNRCSGSVVGIGIGDQATPTLEENICSGNESGGIAYKDAAAGVARRNQCTGNGSGILLIGQAQPTLEENLCSDNETVGINFDENSTGVARRNECAGNGIGLRVGAQAQPTLEDNICFNNQLPSEHCAEPDLQTLFEECVQSGVGVRYAVSGNGVDAVSLTWENDSGGTEQGDYDVPFCKTYTDFQDGDFLYISAQIIEPTSYAGSITCRIYSGMSVIAEANAHGFPSIATCSGSLK